MSEARAGGQTGSAPPGSPGRPFRLLAAATALALWALVAVGGVVRVSESGLGCPDWPLCDGRLVPAAQKEPLLEYAHRATAAVAIVLLAAAALSARRGRLRGRRDVSLPLLGALALVPLQALLGAVVVWLELPGRLVGVHFMVGTAMLALAAHACVAAWRGGRRVSATFARTATAAVAAGLLLLSLGASVVATDAMHACGEEWPACNGGLARGGDLAVLQVAHRSAGYVVALVCVLLLALGLRRHAPLAVAAPPAALALGQVGLGAGLVLSAHGSLQHDALRMLHVAGAAAVWASLVVAFAVAVLPASVAPRAATRPAAAAGRGARTVSRRLAAAAAAALATAAAVPLVAAVALGDERGGTGLVTGTIWVANEGSDSLTAIDAATHAVVAVVRGVAGPHNVQASPDGRTVWVTSPPRGVAAALDAETLALRGAVPAGADPAHVVLTPDGRLALVTSAGGDAVELVDAGTLRRVGRVPLGHHPHGVRPSPDGRAALVAELGGSTVALVDLGAAAVRARIEVGRAPVQVAYAPGGRIAYASVGGEDAVVKLDLARRRVVGRAPAGRGPVQLAVTPDGRTLVVAAQGTRERPHDRVSLVDTATMAVTAVLRTGAGAHGVAIEPDGRQAFVTDAVAGDVAVVDLRERRVVDRIAVGGEPNGVCFSARRQPGARAAATAGRPLEVTLPLGGARDGGGHHHGHD